MGKKPSWGPACLLTPEVLLSQAAPADLRDVAPRAQDEVRLLYASPKPRSSPRPLD
jgi:hypothetical protein